MTPVVSDREQMRIRRDFLFGLNNTAMYAATRYGSRTSGCDLRLSVPG